MYVGIAGKATRLCFCFDLDKVQSETWIRFSHFCFPFASTRPTCRNVTTLLLAVTLLPSLFSTIIYMNFFLLNILFVLISVVLWFISSIAKVFNESNAFHWFQCFDQIPHNFWKIFIYVARLTLWHCFVWHYKLLVGLLLVWLTRLAFSQPLGLDPGQSHGKSIQVLLNLTSVFSSEAKCVTYDLLAILVLFCSSGIFYIVKIKVSHQELKTY